MNCFSHRRDRIWIGVLAIAALFAALAATAIAVQDGQQRSAQAAPPASAAHTPIVPPPKLDSARVQQATNVAKQLSVAFHAVAEKVLPSVVTIEHTPKLAMNESKAQEQGAAQQQSPFGDHNPFEGTPFGDLFRNQPFGKDFRFEVPPSVPRGFHGRSMGSGVIIDRSGLILTNNHVVAGGGDITVRLSDGREFKATDVKTDPKSDLAVVRIDGVADLVPAKLGNSDGVGIGDWAIALGQPFGLESTVTAGIISAKHRGVGIAPRENFLQTDASINPGNSGGPLVNLDGEVIGINTAISSRSGGNEGIGFAIPVNLAKWVANQLVKEGKVHRAYLGVGIQQVTQPLAEQFHVKPREGVVVTDVFPDTPAAKAGLKSGDVIVGFGGMPVTSPQELQLAVERTEMGQSQTITVLRDGRRMNLSVTPLEQPDNYGEPGASSGGSLRPESTPLGKLGLEISDLDPAVAEQLDLNDVEGVIITGVQSGSPAQRAGLESGLVIEQVERQAVKSVDDVNKVLQDRKLDDGILLLVRNKTGSRFVVLKP